VESNRVAYLEYLHINKEDNFGKAEELGLSEKALDNFIYSLGEVELNMEVNIETGETWIIGIAGTKLEEPVRS